MEEKYDMSKPHEIETKGLKEPVLIRFLETGNLAQVAREYDVNYFNLVHYVTWVKENHPEWLEEYGEKVKVNVFRSLNKYINKIDKKLEKWDSENEDKKWLFGIGKLRDYLSTYMEALEKIYNIQKQQEIKDVILQAIREEAPETAMKIMSRLKALKEDRGLLE
jgi:hypothetical protein